MAEKRPDSEDHKLWWPTFLVAAFLVGALTPTIQLAAKGGAAAWMIGLMNIASVVLALVAFKRLRALGAGGGIYTVIVFFLALCAGSGVAAWIMHIFTMGQRLI